MNYETAAPSSAVGGEGKGFWSKAVTILILVFALSLFSSLYSVAQGFTATTLGDYGNITVMKVTGDYDAELSDGSINAPARQEIAKEFFRTHRDEYDFLVIFTNFNFQMPDAEVEAFYLDVKNDTSGIGRELFDNTAFFGSDGKLQGIIDMGNVSDHALIPLDPGFEDALDILAHEMMHRWGAYVKFKDAGGNISDALLYLDPARYAAHWSFLLDSDASVLYGNRWQDNVDGTFTSIGARKYFSPLDLYLMGFADQSQVPPMRLIENPDVAPERLPEVGATIEGTSRYITIENIIAAEGVRHPGPSQSQKTFKSAFIFITRPGTFTSEELAGLENIREGWMTRFSILTDGAGKMRVASILKEDLPANPGVVLPPSAPRTLPPSIDDGVNWLMAHQAADGSWTDKPRTRLRDTVSAIFALKNFDMAWQSYLRGIQWLSGADAKNLVYLSMHMEALQDSGEDINPWLGELLNTQNPDGGWGSQRGYMSNATDTSFVLRALAAAGHPDPQVISKALEYLKERQHPDGGWGSDDGESSIQATTNALYALNAYRQDHSLEEQKTKGIAWLVQKQHPDGGFGNSPSTVYDTALAVLALREFAVATEVLDGALNYILDRQSEDGSWYASPYQTALAVRAVWRATMDPDLSIKISDITFSPSSVKRLPLEMEIRADIWNLGRTDVPQAKVVLYEGELSEQNKAAEQILPFPGESSVMVRFPMTITDGEEHGFIIAVDPENLVEESNELNNAALNALLPKSSYDFEILPSDVSVAPDSVDIFHDVRISSRIRNRGTVNAYNVQLEYIVDIPGEPIDIATVTLDIPAGTTIDNQMTWRTDRAGVNLPIAVRVDPFEAFIELTETNNQAATSLTVNESKEPNLSISYEDIEITPTPANQGGTANISALVRNEGFSGASGIRVDFYRGVPGEDGLLLGSRMIPNLDAGKSETVSMDWADIAESGNKIIYVRLDPDNEIVEIIEDDNNAFVTLKILSLPDLAVSTNAIALAPAAPKDGDMVAIDIVVENTGEQDASDVSVTAYEGSLVLESQRVSSIPGTSQARVSFTYDTAGKSGLHEVMVMVDPDHTIDEQNEQNNQASHTFGVQDADLWLTEPHISPNGDGIKDGTHLFFRLDVPQTVSIVVVNEGGQTIRTYSGAEFEETTGGMVAWDGLDDRGVAAGDGPYQMQILDENENHLGSLLVVVDNNRSPLIEAIGTKFLLDSHLKPMPNNVSRSQNYYRWSWFPDESGILYYSKPRSYYRPPSEAFPMGLFKITPDGQEVVRLGLTEWNEVQYGNWGWHYDLGGVISPDGQKVAITVRKRNHSWWFKIYFSQLWIVDGSGRRLTLLDSIQGADIWNVAWAPDNEHIAYTAGGKLRIIRPDGTGKTEIGDEGLFKWSPDSQRIAYPYDERDANGTIIKKSIRLSDPSGNREDIYVIEAANVSIEILDWLDDQKLLVEQTEHYYDGSQHRGGILKIDAGGAESPLKLFEYIDYIADMRLSPNKKHIAFKYRDPTQGYGSANDGSRYYIYISDMKGNPYVHEVIRKASEDLPDGEWCESHVKDMVWSPDGGRLALIEGIYNSEIGEFCEGHGDLVVIDIRTQKEKRFPVPSPGLDLETWLPDGDWIMVTSHETDEEEHRISVINAQTAEIFPVVISDGWLTPIVSPQGRYIGIDESGSYPDFESKIRSIGSLLNLTADLRVSRDRSGVILKGIAQDLNFEGYRLEYVDQKIPGIRHPISTPADVPVVNDVFTTWVPPGEGTFDVTLTVWDKAGNLAQESKLVSWGIFSSITNLYKTHDIFSPNGDGVKDTVELHYRVLEPVHLEFYVYDRDDRLIRTILKDHISSEQGYISWDGKDESGNTVPDGKYAVRVLDYQFFFQVDNTPPVVHLALSPLKQAFVRINLYEDYALFAELAGRAVDNNLRYWVVEYGEGDNPDQWYEYKKDANLLVDRDERGNPILDSGEDALIEQVKPGTFVGKRLRITAVDFAGNRSAMTAEVPPEEIFFHIWHDPATAMGSYDPLDPLNSYRSFNVKQKLITNYHGPTVVGATETFSKELTSLIIQYSKDGNNWHYGKIIDAPSYAEARTIWDTSRLDPPDFPYLVRIKAIDIFGHGHNTNVARMDGFKIVEVTCSAIRAFNGIPELGLLKFQVQSDEDPDYPTWTDFRIYDGTKEPIPTDEFGVGLPAGLKHGMKYGIRMAGTGANGQAYESPVKSLLYPLPFCVDLKLKIEYTEAQGCEEVAPGRATLIAEVPAATNRGSLIYHIRNSPGVSEVLKSFDFSKADIKQYSDTVYEKGFFGWGWYKHLWHGVETTVDTAALAEGIYPIKETLEFEYGDSGKKGMATNDADLIVDRTLPAARITYPGESLLVCPVKVSDPQGDWFGVPIEGIATDANDVKRYELYHYDMSIPVSGEGPVTGRMGIWDVTHTGGLTFPLKLKVVDVAGNVSCHSTDFSLDNDLEISNLSADPNLFSSSIDGTSAGVDIGYHIPENATVDLRVSALNKTAGGSFVLDATPLRTLHSGLPHAGGAGSALWDGKDDSGIAVPDGKYGVAVLATDSCENTRQRWIAVEVDNTSPITQIAFPASNAPVGAALLEVKGTAADVHFRNYVLEAGPGESPDTWSLIAQRARPVENHILGKWNTFGLEDIWTLRLTATDTVGHESTTRATIDLGHREGLIKYLDAAPGLFSPNADGKLDITIVNYELTAPCNISIAIYDAQGAVKKTDAAATPSAGTYSYAWDGTDDAGAAVPDGPYGIKVSAALSSDTSVSQAETVSVTVDNTPPAVDIQTPAPNAFIKKDVTVNGTIVDASLVDYAVKYTKDAGSTVLLDEGYQSRVDYTFGIIHEPPEGRYSLQIAATDLGENTTEMSASFTVDRTKPLVTLHAPQDGDYYGSGKERIHIGGAIIEDNLGVYILRYGPGDQPTQWTELLTGDAVPIGDQLFSWNVGQDAGLPDGLYTLSLFAKDKADSGGEAKVRVTIDNGIPVASITSPGEGGYVTKAVDVQGTAFDQNLVTYALEVAAGECGSAFKWAAIRTSASSVQDGILASWQELPPDGAYCLRLTVTDQVGNRVEALLNVKVDTRPPVAPVLSGQVENKTEANLNWSQNAEPDLAGYNLYRDHQKINVGPLTDIHYLDQNLGDGRYVYTIKAVDLAGWESLPSNALSFNIDLVGPEARIVSPREGSTVSGHVEIRGTAFSADDFREYRVYAGQGSEPPAWALVRRSTVPFSLGALAQWDATGLGEGVHAIKLEAEDISGNINTHQIAVTIDDTPPAAPVRFSVERIGSDVSASWQANTEPDLAGYLLYKNGRLVNASGIAAADLGRYLLTDSAFLDIGPPDGRFTYYVLAVDGAGNISERSNTAALDIDTGPPQAEIVDPPAGIEFEKTLMIKAESSDLDINTIQFQFRAENADWKDLGPAVSQPPYITYLNPVDLTHGSYQLRAMATDTQGNTDPAPAFITVSYRDLTPPGATQDLRTLTMGGNVTLRWTAGTETDLDGYNVYRTSGEARTKISSAIVSQETYQDVGLADGMYVYQVTAVDIHGNESQLSVGAYARIYAPLIEQPYTPLTDKSLLVEGGHSEPVSTVELYLDTGSGAVSQGSPASDVEGNFILYLDNKLALGENRVTAIATDSAGNVSRVSEPVVVVYNEPPAAPTDLTALVQDHDVSLAWEANTEPDLLGYNLYRDGQKVNDPMPVTSADTTGTSYYDYTYLPPDAFDSDPSTYWMSRYCNGPADPVWWELALPARELINRVEIHWGTWTDSPDNEIVYGGKDYEIQVWSGYAWITQVAVTGNDTTVNAFDFDPSYRTEKIRIFITSPMDSSKLVRISEVMILRENLTITNAHKDEGRPDGE